jgi:hypothetical protein
MGAMKYYQGRWTPKNPSKYVGDVNQIVYRSGWELRLFKWLDETTDILKWGSEEIVIPYVSPIDHQIHRYFPDVIVQYRDMHGSIHKALLEVKPYDQTCAPEKRNSKKYLTEVATYAVNQAKWDAASRWCKTHGIKFMLITEYELGLKKRKS